MLKPTQYELVNYLDGHRLQDSGWDLADKQSSAPSLIRADYSNKKFSPREDLE